MTNKQKEALAYEVMCAAVDRLLTNEERGLTPNELKDVDMIEMRKQLTVWLKHLPGNIWHLELPTPAQAADRQ